MTELAGVFTRMYRENHWRSAETRSGVGSEMGRTQNVRERLPWLLAVLGARSILDAGCGDLNWLQHTDLPEGLLYRGCDCVPDLVAALDAEHGDGMHEFFTLDITCDPLPRCDLILCRTVLFHLSLEHIAAALGNFAASGASWLLTTTYPFAFPNEDIRDGGWWRLNLQAEPFCLPSPWLIIPEDEVDPAAPFNPGYLGLWRLDKGRGGDS